MFWAGHERQAGTPPEVAWSGWVAEPRWTQKGPSESELQLQLGVWGEKRAGRPLLPRSGGALILALLFQVLSLQSSETCCDCQVCSAPARLPRLALPWTAPAAMTTAPSWWAGVCVLCAAVRPGVLRGQAPGSWTPAMDRAFLGEAKAAVEQCQSPLGCLAPPTGGGDDPECSVTHRAPQE